MGPFEYLSVLISIVLGLGITHLLMGFARWVEARSEFQVFGPSLAWAGFLLMVHIQTWWTMFGYRTYEEWTFLQFVTVLAQPILLFLLAVIVFPSSDAKRRDPKENFFHQRPWFFGFLAALIGVSLLKDLVRDGRLPEAANLVFHGAFLTAAVLGLALRRERGHRFLAYSTLFLFLVYIVLLFFEL